MYIDGFIMYMYFIYIKNTRTESVSQVCEHVLSCVPHATLILLQTVNILLMHV